MIKFKVSDVQTDDWLRALRLKNKGDKESLKKLKEMEDEELVTIDSLRKPE